MGLPDETIDGWLRALLSSTREFALILIGQDGRIVAWLGAAELLFGYPASEAVGMPFSRLFNEDDVARGLDVQECDLARAGGRSEDDRWHVRKDGSRFWGAGVMEAVLDPSGEIVMLAKTVRDRTDVRTQVQTLQTRLAEAERLHAERLTFHATLAHELRNQAGPLAHALSVLERASPGALSERSLGVAQEKLRLMKRLLDDLAEASTFAAPTLVLGPVNIHTAIGSAARAIEPDVRRLEQTLRITLPSTPIVIEADAQRVDQMIGNLLSNASKYSPRGGAIQLSATVETDMVAIRVEDEGIGIAPDVLPRIFELFTRGPQAQVGGLGLGLAVVKQLVTLHSGFIEGRSPGPGNGSVFTLRLPLTQPAGSTRS